MRLRGLPYRVRVVHRRGGYYPFTQPSFRGSYLVASRVPNANTKGFLKTVAFNNAIPLRTRSRLPLSLYEDRRLWHPSGANAWPRSKTQTYPYYIDKQPIPNGPDPGPFFPSRPMRVPKPGHLFRPMLPVRNYNAIPMATWSRPLDMIICLKRKIRREMIHVARHIMGSKFRPRARKMTQFSYVRCS